MQYNQTLLVLNEILRMENIKRIVTKYYTKVNERVTNNFDKTKWYYHSYPIILKRYDDTRGFSNEEYWIERLALLSSWLPSIINPLMDERAIKEIVYLEKIFYEIKLEEIGVESYLGVMNTKHHNDMIIDTASGRPPILIANIS